jgi:hypothetical protein
MTCPDGVRLWEVKTGRQLGIVDTRDGDGQKQAQTRCVYAAGGKTLVTASLGYDICFWDLLSGQELGRITLKELLVPWLCLSSDGQTLALSRGHGDQRAEIYELSTRTQIRELKGKKVDMPCVTIAPDGVTVATSDFLNKGVVLWNLYTGEEIAVFTGHDKYVYQVAFSPDSRTLVSASADGTLIFWKVPEIEAPGKATEPTKLAQSWDKLTGDDAKAAYQAIWDLRQTGDRATDHIRERIKPVAAVGAATIQKLVADLDDSVFATRKKAADELSKLGELAEPALRKALEGEPSAEMRKQVQSLLSRLRFPTYHGEPLRALRAIQVLERIGTPKARDVLGELAKGAEGAKLTRDAKAALDRLNRRAAEKK